MDIESPAASGGGQSRFIVWLSAFVIGMFGAGYGARWLGLGPLATFLVMIPPMLLLIPAVRASERRQAACGVNSPALARYNRRAMIWSFGYMIALFLAVTVQDRLHPSGPALWLIAVLPALPILYLIWAMGRYLVEETDEYLRLRQTIAALIATGILLALATFWGFLESFGLVPHAAPWLAVAVWAVGLMVGNVVNWWRQA